MLTQKEYHRYPCVEIHTNLIQGQINRFFQSITIGLNLMEDIVNEKKNIQEHLKDLSVDPKMY